MSKLFYLDSCIWLNLFKKEGDVTKGIPYWKLAESFIKKIIFSKHNIVYSGFVLKEIKFKLNNENLFRERLKFIKRFRYVKSVNQDYSFARKLELQSNYETSFYDCLHIVLCKRLSSILVTRDAELIKFARKYIVTDKPEKLPS